MYSWLRKQVDNAKRHFELGTKQSSTEELGEVGEVEKRSINESNGHIWILDISKRHSRSKTSVNPITSPPFSFTDNKYNWNLISVPCDEYLTVYVQLSTLTPVDAYIWLSLIDTKNRKVNKKLSIKKHCFSDKRSLAGFSKFVSMKEVFDVKSQLLHDNIYLKIHCVVSIVERHNVSKDELRILSPFLEEGVLRESIELEKLLKSQRFSDVTLVSSDGVEFRAHKAILSARSPYFKAMFSNEMLEQAANSIVMDDLTGKVLDIVLLHIYACRVREFESMNRELFIAADKYALDDLKECCEKYLCRQVKLETAVDLLVFSDMYNAKFLKDTVTRFFLKRSKDIASTKDFECAKNSHPALIAELFTKMALIKK